MKTEIYLISTKGLFEAKGFYTPEQTVVLKGSKISVAFTTSEKFKGVNKVHAIRDDRSLVDEHGLVLKDCSFRSPSSAAQFVTGRSSNGYVVWHVDEHTKLKHFVGK